MGANSLCLDSLRELTPRQNQKLGIHFNRGTPSLTSDLSLALALILPRITSSFPQEPYNFWRYPSTGPWWCWLLIALVWGIQLAHIKKPLSSFTANDAYIRAKNLVPLNILSAVSCTNEAQYFTALKLQMLACSVVAAYPRYHKTCLNHLPQISCSAKTAGT